MRVLALLGVLGLGASAYFAPRHFEARPGSIDETRLVDTDPEAKIALADGPEKALATGLAGAKERGDGPLRLDYAFRIWAAAPSQPDLPEMVREEVRLYLDTRGEMDPDGTVVRKVIDTWIAIRLANTDFMIQLGPAVWAASRGDKRGVDKLNEFVSKGPFDRVYLPYVRRSYHPQWTSVRPIVEHYLEQGDQQGRLLAAATLIDYHSLWGLGEDLLQPLRKEILQDLKAACRIGKRRIDFMAEPHAILSSLALLGDEGVVFLKAMPELKLDENVDLLRVARMWAGLDPFSKVPIGSLKWRLLDPDTQSFYFEGAVHRLLKLAREGKQGKELAELLEIVKTGVESNDQVQSWVCVTGLMALGEPHRTEQVERCRRGGGPLGVLMASTVPSDADFSLLLHNVTSEDPLLAGISAAMLALSGPPPLQGPVD